MKRHLIISGPQGSGKNELGDWLESNTLAIVHDEMLKEDIERHFASNNANNSTNVYLTQETVTYEDFTEDQFLIIQITPNE